MGFVTLLLFLSLFSPNLSANNYQDREVAPSPSKRIERNVKLEGTAGARSRKIRALLQANAKTKLSVAANEVLKSLAKNSNEGGLLDLAKAQVALHFVDLSVLQSDLLVFYVLEELAQLLVAQDDLNKKLDSMNEMSETTSLRLQMMMDRRSKLISTLSNLLKKISTTQDTIVQNLK